MTLLATFVQLSDLHIGSPGPNGDSHTSEDVKRLASTYAVFQGSLGHQLRSLRQLEQYLSMLRATGESFEVILTGDLTRCGGKDELGLANHYLTTSASFPSTNPVPTGLQLGALPQHVAGNHDHWGGYNSIFSTAASHYKTTAPYTSHKFPYVKSGRTIAGYQFTFIGIDSDADVNPGSPERILGQGHFLSQIASLRKNLPPCKPKEFRVLVIHHARNVTNLTLRMTSPSLASLNQLMAWANVKVVLSGHTHETYTTPPIAGVIEFSSRSTTQIDRYPIGWRDIFNRPPKIKLKANGFLIHRVHSASGNLKWVAHVLIRDPSGGFREVATTTYTF